MAFTIGVIGAIVALREPMEAFTAEVLSAARERWVQSGIRDYRLRYNMHGSAYDVTISEGIVVVVSVDGQSPRATDLGSYGMNGLFDILDMELENLTDPNGPFAGGTDVMIARVRFNVEDGYVERYLRSGGGVGRGALIEVRELVLRR